MTTEQAPNGYCVILGVPGTNPLTIVGPFDTEEAASAHAAEHRGKNPEIQAAVDVLVNPTNC